MENFRITAVLNFVKAMGGDAKKIDTNEEYQCLAEFMNGIRQLPGVCQTFVKPLNSDGLFSSNGVEKAISVYDITDKELDILFNEMDKLSDEFGKFDMQFSSNRKVDIRNINRYLQRYAILSEFPVGVEPDDCVKTLEHLRKKINVFLKENNLGKIHKFDTMYDDNLREIRTSVNKFVGEQVIINDY